ncbi:MAG TPA: hypothetical protein VNY05_32445 [Candidatus Acidoferrales bacterium]|nr:hypothetical protein [Candidatus Acidoferrales bacterium]
MGAAIDKFFSQTLVICAGDNARLSKATPEEKADWEKWIEQYLRDHPAVLEAILGAWKNEGRGGV